MIYALVKRVGDIVLSCIALIFLLPLFLIVVIGIEISDPGPLFYCAKRVGLNKTPFSMYKFRTMRVNNEKGHIITLRGDSRIFAFGAFLRKTKIDELPQLINILKGEMSIVGWRPEDIENVECSFGDKFKEILKTKPGLTSPGSLYDYTHGELYETEEEYTKDFLPIKMELELYYVKHRSLKYDISLIVRTIIVIIQITLGKTNFEPPIEVNQIQ